jgi:pimeloyl-ACP methyl ester carboxylesterase
MSETATSRFLLANGLRHYLRDGGTGTAVLMLHGFPDTGALWRYQIQPLIAAGHRVIVPDLRGRGLTEAPSATGDYHLDHVVSDVLGILDALEIQEVHLVAQDWGASAGWRMVALHPQRFSSYVSIAIGHPSTGGSPTQQQLQMSWYRCLFARPDAEALLQERDWYLLRQLVLGSPDADRYVDDLRRPQALTAALAWYRANLAMETLLAAPPALPPITRPTLGLWGSEDKLLAEHPISGSGRFVQSSWRYVRLEGIGHWISLEAPQVLTESLVTFWNALK